MITAIIEQDHDAGREFLADVGNATQPAWDGREQGIRGFAALWQRHGAILAQVVAPRLTGHGSVLDPLLDQQRLVAERAGDLVRRASGHDADGRWLVDFEALKALFDAQCLREETELLPLIRDHVPPADVADMTRQARALGQPPLR